MKTSQDYVSIHSLAIRGSKDVDEGETYDI